MIKKTWKKQKEKLPTAACQLLPFRSQTSQLLLLQRARPPPPFPLPSPHPVISVYYFPPSSIVLFTQGVFSSAIVTILTKGLFSGDGYLASQHILLTTEVFHNLLLYLDNNNIKGGTTTWVKGAVHQN